MATRDLTRVTTSLDTPVGDGDTTFGELHTEETAPLEDEVLEREQEKAVDAALAKLPEKERRIIKARFGTGGRPERALREAAREVGVTQEQARRLEERALARLSQDGTLDDFRDAA
jgi:RNA polymerase primary sigma factor